VTGVEQLNNRILCNDISMSQRPKGDIYSGMPIQAGGSLGLITPGPEIIYFIWQLYIKEDI